MKERTIDKTAHHIFASVNLCGGEGERQKTEAHLGLPWSEHTVLGGKVAFLGW